MPVYRSNLNYGIITAGVIQCKTIAGARSVSFATCFDLSVLKGRKPAPQNFFSKGRMSPSSSNRLAPGKPFLVVAVSDTGEAFRGKNDSRNVRCY
jgi:hypothetical protein